MRLRLLKFPKRMQCHGRPEARNVDSQRTPRQPQCPCLSLYGEFLHDGPKGCNLCIVADFLGFSLRQAITDYYDDGNHLESGDILRLGGRLIEALKPLRSFTRLASLPIEVCLPLLSH